MNKAILIGNLTKDVDLRYTPSGAAIADFGMAINESYKSKDGEKKDSNVFVWVTVWANTAENCAKFIGKGSKVLVEGRLKFDQWEKDGKKFSKLSVTGDNVQFLSRPSDSSQTVATPAEDDGLPF